jgi:cell division septum initiation protein DivIVA
MSPRRLQFDEVRYPGFRVRFRGFDRTEVVAAFAKLASENEDARREIDRLGSEIDRLQASVTEQYDSERDVQRALVAASKFADDIRIRAEEEAHQIRRDAAADSETIVQQLRETARELQVEIDTLLARRRDVEASIASFIKAMSDELDRVSQKHTDEPGNGALAKTG